MCSITVQRHGLNVTQILITHGHIDHVGGAMKLKQATGAPILMNKNDAPQLQMLDMQADMDRRALRRDKSPSMPAWMMARQFRRRP